MTTAERGKQRQVVRRSAAGLRKSVTLSEVVGLSVRDAREKARLTQDQLAESARKFGLGWGRSSVAQLEAGSRAVTMEELLLLPWLLAAATGGSKVPIPELLATAAPEGQVVLGHGASVRGKDLPLLLGADLQFEVSKPRLVRPDPDRRQGIEMAAGRLAEQKAAVKLGVPSIEVARAAFRLWHHGLTEERDRRLVDSEELSTRSLQAARGHITRQLLSELAELMEERKK